ncbi:NAD(P)-dependent oxidoreductase [Xanthovirga aplysinae]|uniref:NAD(P)-dependent oxidoreductase n=1 Tax=Xanthovirga aplysinae TaxID=2529853 RepID=UPI0012BBF297|nr:SDR family oxidoreductase [Xanthovirga aplysinae]MTI31821.1 SDR family oxidoreductase [Xanthovirga aplysinae]
MNVIIFGSTGTIGKHLVEQSLKEGHQVTAFCRNSDKLNYIKNPNLKVMEGNVFDPESVQDAIKGKDVVCIALGSGNKRKGTVRSQGTKIIIEAMRKNGVNRLICQTTLGCGESKNNLNFFWKNIMFGWYLKNVLLDHELQEEYVMKSGLDWTIVRPGAFSDGPKTGNYRQGFDSNDKSLQLKISRADVADFILKQLQTNNYLHKAPGLSY